MWTDDPAGGTAQGQERPEFRVLGPFEVLVHGRPLDLGGPRIRTLLALLIANAGRVISVDTMASALWDVDATPGTPRTVRTYMSRLRRSLAPGAALGGGDLIETRAAGYALRLEPALLDAREFERLVTAGRTALAADPVTAADRLSRALALWRGDAYEDFSGTAALLAETRRLQALRLGALQDRIDADLATGAGEALIGELTALSDRHPGHERLWGQLMTALYRAGRQADALDTFARARVVLVERFGLDPTPRLTGLHHRILDNDPRLFPPSPSRPVTGRPAGTIRNDLPGDIADFTGREPELSRLLSARDGVVHTAPTAVVIEAIDGMAGIGKTTLAIHAAHRLAGHYRDAQLFIDLHGHTSGQAPITPAAALDTLLRALGVAADRIPLEPDARAALWRAELAGRSVVVVLDNAADAAQVRPLLPGSPGTLLLITSRRRLVGLEAAHILSLDVLPEATAVALFSGIVADDRPAAEAAAVRDVVALCGHLPLAIRIAAARLRTRPAWTVAHLADRLRQAGRPLAELSAGDRSVAAAFALSYEHLDEAGQRMFRLLGLNPGPDIDVPAAAALAAVAPAEAERLLESLVDDHLLQQPATGRFRFHDLVRQHAQATALADEPAPARTAALRRLVGFHLHTGHRGSRLLDQQHPPIDVGEPPPGCVPAPLPDDTAAMTWFDGNHQCVLAARQAAEDAGWDTWVWQLAWTLDNFHYRRGHLQANITSWLAGLAAAERLGDVAVQARAHRRLGLVYGPFGMPAEALPHLNRSLALAGEIGDTLGQAGVHFVLALHWTNEKDDERALEHATSAQELYGVLDDGKWEARAFALIGACLSRLGRHEEARSHAESGLALCRESNDVYGQADALDSLAAIARETGHHGEALEQSRRALSLWRHLDNTYRQAGTLAAMGDAHQAQGHPDQALEAWHQALDLYRAGNLHPAADEIEKRAANAEG
ncbi:SARP family transcriptional regulator [Amycolatopsis mediterranei S699]|uniref:SARP family transcriptional regulator n=2 Tax=Amycolatopsis mediterranei TaxID=33910 RepID=A0A0H3DAE3_AMYMU|nr:BTAD domain-containing putative transcriptional regulator [Amycolatopsis mediterranei]ADJ46509.1 SARP family transcriptional regulator [Amycolatopsis mediterranei U32]AEK43309.1 SARP family transcriptional regulator [Amycolatopsis mediterranei S699]AFO78220.1 SARP family transcriptional regulator [Amycolatopsis mediterranei S699]AGT85348.1 SARP family transcriptional regulator [Amycolatopsis mediterranei RB]KDO06398.1 SARP family transcriptional regulator [Amycolatopsis mediterranei]